MNSEVCWSKCAIRIFICRERTCAPTVWYGTKHDTRRIKSMYIYSCCQGRWLPAHISKQCIHTHIATHMAHNRHSSYLPLLIFLQSVFMLSRMPVIIYMRTARMEAVLFRRQLLVRRLILLTQGGPATTTIDTSCQSHCSFFACARASNGCITRSMAPGALPMTLQALCNTKAVLIAMLTAIKLAQLAPKHVHIAFPRWTLSAKI